MSKEVVEIFGNAIPTPVKIPDWNQTDSTKSDYIKNKPDLSKKADKTIRLTKTKKIDNYAVVTDTIPVGSEIVVNVTGLPKLQEEGDFYYVEYGFEESHSLFEVISFTPDDEGNATVSLPVTSDLVPDAGADVVDMFWICVAAELSGVAELAEPPTVEYIGTEDIADAVERHETLINDMSDGLVKGFGVPFDVTGTSFVSIHKVHPKEHDVEIATDAESVTVLGKNLCNHYFDDAKTDNFRAGLSKSNNDDGSFNLSGKLTQNYRYCSEMPIFIPKGTNLVASGCWETPHDNVFVGAVVRSANGILLQANNTPSGQSKSVTLTEDAISVGFIFRFQNNSAGDTVGINNIKIQLEIGSVATEWEEYKGITYPVEDGKATVKSVSPTMNITTPTSGASIEAKGYQDGLAVIDELKQAILSLGGNI